MKNFLIVGLLDCLIAASAVAAEEPARSPLEIAEENAARAAKFSSSIVTVRYFVKLDAEGRVPKFLVPYKCPNCHGTHWKERPVSYDQGIPAEFAGFLIAPDRVLMSDIDLDAAFIDRIEVLCGDETRAAEEFELAVEQRGMILKLKTPFEKAKPLAFTGGPAPKDPKYFYLTREEGVTVAGVASSKAAALKYICETGKSVYEGNPNTLVLDAQGEPVTVALQDRVVLGEEVFSAPTTWKTEPIVARAARREAFVKRIARGVLPVVLQFEACSKDDDRGPRYQNWGPGDVVSDDENCLGIVLEGGTVIIPKTLVVADTARLAKIEATLPDGTKIPLTFVGSYAEEGALAAKFAADIPKGVEPFALAQEKAPALQNGIFPACYLGNYCGLLKITRGTVIVKNLTRIFGNRTVAEFEWYSGLGRERSSDGPVLSFTAEGKLLSVEIYHRHGSRLGNKDVQGDQLAAMVRQPVFNPENVPRAAGDRKRRPWFGVEVQLAGHDVLREKKAVYYFSSHAVDHAAMVTEVAAGSPAAELGIKVGDILVSAKYPGSPDKEELLADLDYTSGVVELDAAYDDERFIDAGSGGAEMPWPNVEGGVNSFMAKFGVGSVVEVSWVSEGVLKRGKVKLTLAPVHFRTAPRARNKDLAITVCDMTAEVRKFFKFDEKAPGVVIVRVKNAGTGAVAGLRPLELITEVNGEGVSSAKDFLEKTRGKKEFSLTVRRLSTTRVVPIKIQ